MNTHLVIDAAVDALAQLGVRVAKRPAGMLGLRVDKRGAERLFPVTVLDRVTAPLASVVEPATDGAMLIVAPFIPEPAAQVLRERGLDYVDAAGNAHLKWDGVLIDVRGRRRPLTSAPRAGPSARRPFTRSGTQVTFALLAWPTVRVATVREIARASGTAVGTVQAVVRDLYGGGYLIDAPSGRRLVRTGELLTRWTEAYALTLATSLHMGAYRAEDPQWWAQERARKELRDVDVDLGGEAAGAVMDARLRPAEALLYVDAVPAQLLAAHRCRRVADIQEADLLVRRRFWTTPPSEEHTAQDGLVPPILVYADLLVSGSPVSVNMPSD